MSSMRRVLSDAEQRPLWADQLVVIEARKVAWC